MEQNIILSWMMKAQAVRTNANHWKPDTFSKGNQLRRRNHLCLSRQHLASNWNTSLSTEANGNILWKQQKFPLVFNGFKNRNSLSAYLGTAALKTAWNQPWQAHKYDRCHMCPITAEGYWHARTTASSLCYCVWLGCGCGTEVISQIQVHSLGNIKNIKFCAIKST